MKKETSSFVAEDAMKQRQSWTPGPWTFGGLNTRHIYGPDAHAICTMHAFEEFLTPWAKEQIKNDARLIAASPALLEALRELADVAERIGPPKISRGGLCEEEDWSTSMRLARAAIALATEGE